MYDNMLKEMQSKMKPVTELAELNRKAAERIFALQSEFFTNSVNASIAQVKALTEVKDPKDAFTLQMNFLKEQEAQWSEVAEQELAALNEVREEVTSIFEQSLDAMNAMPSVDMSAFTVPAFDLKGFDINAFMPKAAAEAETEKQPAAKPAARKTHSAQAASTSA
ncbi:MAG: phasin family protein [Oceanospirillales bacterium]|uniref:Phasin family protein n=1 Tax=Marinobacterium halophilum TaxID=267374 RepID=A0A2P8EUA4_9GAMM|nr:phasin family protein [Marinobacterium halophilum]MBR9828708.1 phasin family protein [Oceanospirillales bacterium]PSL13049.1 phasin family protein [Marinobacterium halophilum]